MLPFKLGFLFLAGLFVVGCKMTSPEQSQLNQIFKNHQRSSIDPESVPYILTMQGGCTGFIVDDVAGIGMTASHCDPSVGSQVCHGLGNSKNWIYSQAIASDSQVAQSDEPIESECSFMAEIIEIIESSPTFDLDYTIFKFKWSSTPTKVGKVVLDAKNRLREYFDNKQKISMVGYPADKYQYFDLTRSTCLVRGAEVKSFLDTNEIREFNEVVIAAWNADKSYTSHPDYQEMRKACFWVGTGNFSRPGFKHDCSVYGGNSGGPMLTDNIVVAMPSTYAEEPSETPGANEDPCISKYWDTFFGPILGDENRPDDDSVASNWDQLDRSSKDISSFPDAIPMFLIVEKSKFLRANPHYLSN